MTNVQLAKKTTTQALIRPIRERANASRLQAQKVAQDFAAVFGKDALGMELHAPDRVIAMLEAHDFALIRLGGDFQEIRHSVSLNDERMVARGQKRIRHAFKEVLAVVLNG